MTKDALSTSRYSRSSFKLSNTLLMLGFFMPFMDDDSLDRYSSLVLIGDAITSNDDSQDSSESQDATNTAEQTTTLNSEASQPTALEAPATNNEEDTSEQGSMTTTVATIENDQITINVDSLQSLSLFNLPDFSINFADDPITVFSKNNMTFGDAQAMEFVVDENGSFNIHIEFDSDYFNGGLDDDFYIGDVGTLSFVVMDTDFIDNTVKFGVDFINTGAGDDFASGDVFSMNFLITGESMVSGNTFSFANDYLSGGTESATLIGDAFDVTFDIASATFSHNEIEMGADTISGAVDGVNSLAGDVFSMHFDVSESGIFSNNIVDFGDDTLSGGSGDDVFWGDLAIVSVSEGDGFISGNEFNMGSDTFIATAGNDTYWGDMGESVAEAFVEILELNDLNLGNNTVDYSMLNASIEADLHNGEVLKVGEDNGLDLVYAIQNVIGTDFDDFLVGGHGDNSLTGGGGSDVFGIDIDLVRDNGNNVVDIKYNGNDRFTDFSRGNALHDGDRLVFELDGIEQKGFADMLTHLSFKQTGQANEDLRLDIGDSGSITFEGHGNLYTEAENMFDVFDAYFDTMASVEIW